MKKKSKLKLFGCCLVAIIPIVSLCQTPRNGNGDKNWMQSSKLFDEFTSGTLGSHWDQAACEGTWPEYGVKRIRDRIKFINDPDNSGDKILVIEPIWNNNFLVTAGLKTYNQASGWFNYGFFEIKCKLPNDEGATKSSFWLFSGTPWREIDIFEYTKLYQSIMPINLHWVPSSNNEDFKKSWQFDYRYDWEGSKYDTEPNLGINLASDYHKYGCEWTPDYINYYFDDKLVRSVEIDLSTSGKDMNSLVNHHMELWITQWRWDPNITGNIDSWYIDYVKVYELGMDECNSDIPLLTSTELIEYDHSSVRRNFSIGDNESNISLNPGDNITLRHSGDVRIYGSFYAPTGCEFTILQTSCY